MTVSDASGVIASPQFLAQLKEVDRVNPIPMPALRMGGYIKLLEPGYDEFTRTFTADSDIQLCERYPLECAKATLDDLFEEFPFVDDRSKAVALAAMLTIFARGILPPKSLRPAFIYAANCPGAGKTLLAKLAVVPVLGSMPAGSKPEDKTEMEKVLLTAAMEARPVLVFDNVKGKLSSPSLEGFITSQTVGGRILGISKSFSGENVTTVLITANDATVSADMARRALVCELFIDVERPEDRVFNQTLEVTQILKRRIDILNALWGLVRNWLDGKLPPTRSHASFPEWANIIGGIVEQAGYACPLLPPKIEIDKSREEMRDLVEKIADGAVERAVDFSEVIELAQSGGLFDLPEGGEMNQKERREFGKALNKYNGRLCGNFRFAVEGKGRGRKYRVTKIRS